MASPLERNEKEGKKKNWFFIFFFGNSFKRKGLPSGASDVVLSVNLPLRSTWPFITYYIACMFFLLHRLVVVAVALLLFSLVIELIAIASRIERSMLPGIPSSSARLAWKKEEEEYLGKKSESSIAICCPALFVGREGWSHPAAQCASQRKQTEGTAFSRHRRHWWIWLWFRGPIVRLDSGSISRPREHDLANLMESIEWKTLYRISARLEYLRPSGTGSEQQLTLT